MDCLFRNGHPEPKFKTNKGIFIDKKSVWVVNRIHLLNELDFSGKVLSEWRFDRPMAVAEAPDGKLWVGKLNGLEIVGHQGERLSLDKKWPKLFEGRITGIVPASNGQMWVATHQNGVAVLDRDSILVKHLTPAEGLTSLICQNIRTDHRGYVWVSTNEGLNKIDPNTFRIERFSTVNVLPNNDVSDVLVVGDTVRAATSGGIAVFLDRLEPTSPDFETAITEIWSDGVRLPTPSGKRLELPSGSEIQGHFAGLSTRSGSRFGYLCSLRRYLPAVQYITLNNLRDKFSAYLAGTERKWEFQLNEPVFLRSDIKAGRYEFVVYAISYDGVRSLHPASLDIWVKPNLMECLWLQILISAILVWAAWRLYRSRSVRAVLERQLVRKQMTILQLQAFRVQINPHFIFNTISGVQRFFFPPDPRAANAYIALFSDLLRKTLDFSKKTSIPFAQELEFMREYLELTQLRVGENFRYKIIGEQAVAPDTEIPSMLLQPLVENAIVHGAPPTGHGVVKLTFEKKDGRLHCLVADNGIGIRASLQRQSENGSAHISHGAEIIQSRIEVLNEMEKRDIRITVTDKCDLPSTSGTGTVAELSFLI